MATRKSTKQIAEDLREAGRDIDDKLHEKGRALDDIVRSAVDPITEAAEDRTGARPGSFKDAGRVVAWVVILVVVAGIAAYVITSP